jgi:hypothetical protein
VLQNGVDYWSTDCKEVPRANELFLSIILHILLQKLVSKSKIFLAFLILATTARYALAERTSP